MISGNEEQYILLMQSYLAVNNMLPNCFTNFDAGPKSGLQVV